MDKSHVSMERKMCVACGKEYESGAILLDRRLKASMERYTTTGYGLCEEHKKEGYLTMVVVDPSKSTPSSDKCMKVENAHRTGEVLFMKLEVAKKMFPCPKGEEMCFISQEFADELKRKARMAERT